MKKIRSSVIGHGDVKIGEYQNSNLFSSIDCSPVFSLLSLKYQRRRFVEHPFPTCCNRLFSRDRKVTKRDKRGGWEWFSFDGVNSKTKNCYGRNERKLIFDHVLRVKLEVLIGLSRQLSLLCKKPWDSKLHQMDYFATDLTCLYDKIKAICSEIRDKNTLHQ